MSPVWRRSVPFVLLFLIAGCKSLFMLPFYLTSDTPKIQAEMHRLADKEGKKEVKVVIVTDAPLETRPELLHADREISTQLAKHLQQLCQANKEKVTVVNPFKVEEFKRENTEWSESHVDLEEIGKHFKADYVIHVEINHLSLYQPGTANQFYQGRANVRLILVNVHKPDDFTVTPRDVSFTWPPETQGGSMVVDNDTLPQAFRQKFLDALARKLSWNFTDRPTSDTYMSQ